MDHETALRRHLREVADTQDIKIWVNNENRMMMTITNADGTQTDFVVVGNTAIPWPIVIATIPEKPPTQRFFASSIAPTAQKGEPGYDPN